mmetsp:Transcript_11701/g.35083  ORF Transcript_11701/g.35083 Transcript_11701/m.35083 type:complete len:250 (+) Transcript_11701:1406-2155(+)
MARSLQMSAMVSSSRATYHERPAASSTTQPQSARPPGALSGTLAGRSTQRRAKKLASHATPWSSSKFGTASSGSPVGTTSPFRSIMSYRRAASTGKSKRCRSPRATYRPLALSTPRKHDADVRAHGELWQPWHARRPASDRFGLDTTTHACCCCGAAVACGCTTRGCCFFFFLAFFAGGGSAANFDSRSSSSSSSRCSRCGGWCDGVTTATVSDVLRRSTDSAGDAGRGGSTTSSGGFAVVVVVGSAGA